MGEALPERLRRRAQELKADVTALHRAARDPRTPWTAKALALAAAAYALSPIDLIPDFIPVLGYLDDLLILPAGIALAIRMTPPEVMEDARRSVRAEGGSPSRIGRGGAALVALVWVVLALAVVLAIRLEGGWSGGT